ncbi:hypothetical protein O3M35_002040 [Rhynocoris fuscipes]|uniref:DNA/RNA-binding protein Kin17 WH-like domain-containing protein n=1 Tax=Rhynocoris fuscipes TaxID=488301 RepID=A0AAW1CPM6_9HEMI
MGKHEVGTPKYIANKIKAKGLQKLRWYCQMCQKQCRDENGFKCHMTSESHHRQLLLFSDNQDKYLSYFSKEFSNGYLELLRRQFGTKRVHANRVYQDYIADRHHLHMNSTQWETLTDFVKWLGREGKCVVDETEKGWFVTYIDRDPDTIKLQEAMAKKEKMDKDDNERMMEFLEKQIARGKKTSKNIEETTPTDLIRSEDEKIVLNLPIKKQEGPKLEPEASPLVTFKKPAIPSKASVSNNRKDEKRKSALDEIIEEEERKKKIKRRDNWLMDDIVVKVITDSLGEKYENKKGVIEKVIDKFVAKEHLETVIPAIGRKVKIVNGGYAGQIAELTKIDTKNFCGSLKICSGPLNGKIVNIPYEDFSKLHEV